MWRRNTSTDLGLRLEREPQAVRSSAANQKRRLVTISFELLRPSIRPYQMEYINEINKLKMENSRSER